MAQAKTAALKKKPKKRALYRLVPQHTQRVENIPCVGYIGHYSGIAEKVTVVRYDKSREGLVLLFDRDTLLKMIAAYLYSIRNQSRSGRGLGLRETYAVGCDKSKIKRRRVKC